MFNVTAYMDFHPGGEDELMRGVGIDATKLFEEVFFILITLVVVCSWSDFTTVLM